MGWKIQHSKHVNFSKLIYSSMQFLTGFFCTYRQNILKCIWKGKGTKRIWKLRIKRNRSAQFQDLYSYSNHDYDVNKGIDM